MSENNTLYTVNLKQNVKFHGGKSFTAHDVIATMEYINCEEIEHVSLNGVIYTY